MRIMPRFVFLLSFFFFSSRRRHTISDRDWSSDVCSSDLHGGEILPVATLNLILIGSLELEHREFFGPALLNDLAGHGRFRGVVAHKDLLVAVNSQHFAKIELLPHFALHPLDADGVAGRDTILLSPGLDNGVHLSSQGPLSAL